MKTKDEGWDSRRETMFNAWKNSKINLTPSKEITPEKATVSVIYNGEVFTETFLKEDCFGSSNYYNIAFNRLLSRIKQINKDIEIDYL
jgi:hypothetical protein